MCSSIKMVIFKSVTNATENPSDRIPEFINPVAYNNGEHAKLNWLQYNVS